MPPSNVSCVEKLARVDRELRHVLGQITELYQALGTTPDHGGSSERSLRELLERRERLMVDLGRAGMAVIAGGASIVAGPPPADMVPLPPAPTVTPAELLEQAKRGLHPSWTASQSGQTKHKVLTETLAALGGPRPLSTPEHHHDAVQRLGRAVTRMDSWLDLPRSLQRALMGLVSSMARQIQEGPPPASALDPLNVTFSRMSAWSREHRPGFVPGLSRHNDPDFGSWLADASHWWAELQGERQKSAATPDMAFNRLRHIVEQGVEHRKELVAAVDAAVEAGLSPDDERVVQLFTGRGSELKGAKGLQDLRDAVASAAGADDAAAAEADEELPGDWPWRSHTEGIEVAVLGGDPRPLAVERLQSAFGFGSLTWDESGVANAEALSDGIAKGSFGLLVVLRRSCSHRELSIVLPVAIASDLPICIVDAGYGVKPLRLAVERTWPADDGE